MGFGVMKGSVSVLGANSDAKAVSDEDEAQIV